MMLKRVLFAAGALAFAAPVQAGEELRFGPAPDWVEPHPVGAPEGEETSQPVRVLLLDNQTRLENGKRTTYSSFALAFQTSQGLSAGNLSLSWRPETDELTVHRVVIRRGDQTIDVLASGQTFTTLRREQNLEQSTLDGVLTANMIPEDLQVGDILEVATSLAVANPVFAQHDEAMIGPLNSPIEKAYVRLLWPASESMRLARSAGMPEWKRTRKGGLEEARIELDHTERVLPPDSAPARYNFLGFLEASDFASWSDLAAHFAPLYARAATLPAEGPLRTEVERIRAASSDPVARAEAALKLVQGRIRYVALAMGEGGLVPADAELTWSRRFGDCKAKTALLLAILGELGIDAEPVFVNTVFGDAVPERLPMIAMFDHVIVRAQMAGRDYWLDGTRTGDGGLARLRTPNFAWGLPVRAGGAELVRMLPAPLDQPTEDLAIELDASKGLRAAMPATIALTLRGDAALATNQVMANFVGEARDRALRDYWHGRFDFIEPGKVAMAYDETAGELRLTLEGQATLDWDGQWYEADEIWVGYRADFTREAGHGQDAPYAVAYPFFDRTRETIILPANAGFTQTSFSNVAEVDETVAGIEYRRHASLTDNRFVIERTQRSVEPEFPARDAPAFEKRLRELRDKRVFLRMPGGYRPTEADLAVLAATIPDNVSDLISQGNELLNAGKYSDALTRFSRATEREPANAVAWANRGIALTWLRSFDEAAAAFDRAESIDSRNWGVSNGRGLMAEGRRDWSAALEQYSKTLAIEPNNLFARAHRASVRMGLQQWELALTDAGDVLRADPKYAMMYGVRVSVLKWLNRRDEAKAEIDGMLAAFPHEEWARRLAVQLYSDLGLTGSARDLAESGVQGAATAADYFSRSRSRGPADTAGQISDLTEALRIDPKFQPALMSRASLRFSTGEPEAALADIAALLELDPKLIDAHFVKADILHSQRRLDEAAAEAEAILAIAPEDSNALMSAAQIFDQIGRKDRAITELDRALAIRPEPNLYLMRSHLREHDALNERLADVEAALRLAPRDYSSLMTKAQLQQEMGDPGSAVETYSTVLASYGANASLLTNRAIALVRAGRDDEADADLDAARKLAADGQQLNGICYEKAMEGIALERALEECNEALRLLPDAPAILDSRGTVLLRLGRLDEAITDFDAALAKMPILAPTLYARAIAYSRQGDAERSRADEAAATRLNANIAEQFSRAGLTIQHPAS